ncbi:DUF2470 domain-containing protein [Spongiactinospora sp. TRM90649]|uniref:DUF2470 domain-containing protein n=1 Tax=Spongiactinospora sp. TRM90649 TaxID=3031114 RepID=UPI0023F841D0|nr:DUF2470 domain-containing protein [Spongiactinospora sp. TRM90649]MDF5751769.1 DUF2470 domain-containing protein [Spongiactinospora sp. TRM90649]
MTAVFSDDVVAAVTRHMNDDHGDDALLICRSLGGRPEATAARTTGVDSGGMDFAAVVDGAEVAVRVPFAAPITERAQIRLEVVRMYREACAALGVPPRGEPGGEH